jgi:hypothetical protein
VASGDLTFFGGFSWAVQRGFRAALACCRFDQGDTLYDSSDAYDKPWEDKCSKLHYSIQVQTNHSATPGTVDDTERAFEASWGDGVTVALTDHKEGETRTINTTQGRLYSVLWKGDVKLFDAANAAPRPPKMAGDLQRELASAAGEITKRRSTKMSGGYVFVFAVDHVSMTQVLKARTVESALRSLGEGESRTLEPGDAGLGGDACPTVLLHSCAVATSRREQIVAALKTRLYKPTKDRKTDVDRFNLERHGWLFELGGR